MKLIGGIAFAVLAVVGTLAFAGRSLEAQDVLDHWLSAENVLQDDTSVSPQPVLADASPELPQTEATQNAPANAQPAAQETPALDPDDPFVIKRVLPISGPIKYGEWHWDDEGIPDGPLRITVDIQARVISVFQGGYEIGAAAALLGTPEHPTPTGVFPILTKERHNVSEKYNNAPMPWTLRLTWDGVAIHGGSTVELGYASHGCIGVPDEFVSRLYDIAKTGDLVIITDGQRATVGSSLAAS